MQIVNKKEKEKIPFSKIKTGECFEYCDPITKWKDFYMRINPHEVIVDDMIADNVKYYINNKSCIEGNAVSFYDRNIQHFSDNTMVMPLKTQLVIMEG